MGRPLLIQDRESVSSSGNLLGRVGDCSGSLEYVECLLIGWSVLLRYGDCGLFVSLVGLFWWWWLEVMWLRLMSCDWFFLDTRFSDRSFKSVGICRTLSESLMVSKSVEVCRSLCIWIELLCVGVLRFYARVVSRCRDLSA
jgi:hypothetical protein